MAAYVTAVVLWGFAEWGNYKNKHAKCVKGLGQGPPPEPPLPPPPGWGRLPAPTHSPA